MSTAVRGYWARDDPAVLLLVLLYLSGKPDPDLEPPLMQVTLILTGTVSTVGYTLWLGLGMRFFLALLWVLLGDCLLVGSIVASIMW